MKFLFVDTETSGLCNMRTPYNKETLFSVWPFLTEISWIVAESEDLKDFNILKSKSTLIKPRKEFTEDKYPGEVAVKTGISYLSLLSGLESSEVLKEFFDDLTKVDYVVAHNSTYDMKVIKAEVLRLGWNNHMRICPWIDTCYYGYQLIKGKQVNGRAKYPTLSELYQRVTGKILDSAHRADADVKTLIIGFKGLCNIETVDKFGNVSPVLTLNRLKQITNKFVDNILHVE